MGLEAQRVMRAIILTFLLMIAMRTIDQPLTNCMIKLNVVCDVGALTVSVSWFIVHLFDHQR